MQRSYNLTVSTLYGKTSSGRLFSAVCLIKLVVCNFCRKSSNVYFFNFLREFISLLAERKSFRFQQVFE